MFRFLCVRHIPQGDTAKCHSERGEESRRRLAFKINAQTDVALKDGVSRALQDKRMFL